MPLVEGKPKALLLAPTWYIPGSKHRRHTAEVGLASVSDRPVRADRVAFGYWPRRLWILAAAPFDTGGAAAVSLTLHLGRPILFQISRLFAARAPENTQSVRGLPGRRDRWI